MHPWPDVESYSRSMGLSPSAFPFQNHGTNKPLLSLVLAPLTSLTVNILNSQSGYYLRSEKLKCPGHRDICSREPITLSFLFIRHGPFFWKYNFAVKIFSALSINSKIPHTALQNNLVNSHKSRTGSGIARIPGEHRRKHFLEKTRRSWALLPVTCLLDNPGSRWDLCLVLCISL